MQLRKIDTRSYAQSKPEEAHIVVAQINAVEPRHDIAEGIAFEQVGILNFEWNRTHSEFFDQTFGVGMAAEEHGTIPPARAVSMQRENTFRDVGALFSIVPIGDRFTGW